MAAIPFALYDAFSDVAFGGSQAAIITGAARIPADARQRIAREFGLPATGFVSACDGRSISVQFMSMVTELPMCGHGTMALVTRMVEDGTLAWSGSERIDVELQLPSTRAAVEVSRRDDGRPEIMLEVRAPSFRANESDTEGLARLLGLDGQDFNSEWPCEVAAGDFVHLVVPVTGLASMRSIKPDFAGLVCFCRAARIDTVVVFCTEVEQPGSTLHVRDFCPAVGVPESAAAGTTNAALTSYLVRHGIVGPDNDGKARVKAEQGIEIERPSSIRSIATLDGGSIVRLQVGGVATRIAEGTLHLPF